jgi:hypothetical protein
MGLEERDFLIFLLFWAGREVRGSFAGLSVGGEGRGRKNN